MEPLKNLFGQDQYQPRNKRETERGELLKYFAGKVDKPIGYVAFRCAKLTIQDLYYIKSVCDQESARGENWGKVFYGMLKVRY